MTDGPTCTAEHGCGNPADGYLCHPCARVLERILAELPATLTDLQTTITRQSRTSRGGGGKPTKAAESPLPFDVHASELADRVRNGLSTWIRHLCETRGVEPPSLPRTATVWANTARGPVAVPAEPISAMAVWLVQHVQTIRQDELAGQLLAELKLLQAELRAGVDNRQHRYAGPCTATLRPLEVTASSTGEGEDETIVPQLHAGEPVQCGADLKRRVGAATIVCKECGADYLAAERGDWIDDRAAEHVATAAQLALVLTESGYSMKAATIRKWGERGRLAAAVARLVAGYGPTCTGCRHPSCDRMRRGREFQDSLIVPCAYTVADRLPLYRVGAVYSRVKADPDRHSIGV